jgi:hypothetical protein
VRLCLKLASTVDEQAMSIIGRIITVLVLFVSLSGLTRGQTSTGSISGTITDQNQALITGAVVTVRNIETGFTRSGTTNSDGDYSFLDLPIGSYELAIEAPTFPKYVQLGIQLSSSVQP